MKRLLAAGYGDMFQIGKVFRQGEQGRYHNPEFTLLEWYRPHWDHWQLMGEVDGLLMDVLNGFIEPEASQHLSYRDAFRAHVGIDPFTSSREDFECAANRLGMSVTPMSDNNSWLDYFMVSVIAPAFVSNCFTYVYDYPASQAALAAIRYDDPPVAERFEVFWGSLELANGYRELTDAVEQHQRFTSELAYRNAHGLVEVLPDSRLIDALASGFPPCSGVAVGVDRMLMLATGAQHIQEVLSFPWERA